VIYKVEEFNDFSYTKFVLLHEIAHSYSVFDEEDADDIALYLLTKISDPIPKPLENYELHKGYLVSVVCSILLKLWSNPQLTEIG
jgi:hypothetical protein